MTRTLSRPQPAATRPGRQRHLPWLTRGCDAALDLAVVIVATWTVVYHACLVLGLGVPWAVGLEAVAAAGWGLLLWRARRRSDASRGPEPLSVASVHRADTRSRTASTVLTAAAVASAVASAVLVAVNASWPAVAGLWLTAGLAGTAWAVLRLRRAPVGGPWAREPEVDAHRGQVLEPLVALGWATALAVLSMLTLRPNPDDLYYVNISQWVVDHGSFPLRDTIFSDLVFPMSSWPPVASYDTLVGTLARLAGVPAASVVYLVVPPVATFLSVLALWRLLRAWRVRVVAVALSCSLVFLLFDGGPGYASPGNFFLTRIWQGKAILLCLMVPVLLVYALRYVERPSRARAGWLFAGGVAAVGLSTSAMFLVPLLALGGAAPLCVRRPVQAVQGFVAMAAYPLAAGAVTIAVGGHSADLFGSRELYRFDPAWFGHEIFFDGPVAALAVAAVLCGALLVPHRGARVTTGVLAVVTGVTFVPGVTRLSYDLVGLGPTLWRVSWVASIAALVGVLGAWAATYPTRRSLRLAAPVALVLVVVVFGLPIMSERNGVVIESAPHWQRSPESIAAAQLAIEAAQPGDVILAPQDLAITIDVLTTRVKTVAPRDYFMDYLRGDPDFHYAERLTLVDFANRELGPVSREEKSEVARALTLLDVDEICLPAGSGPATDDLLRSEGYRPAVSSELVRCLTR